MPELAHALLIRCFATKRLAAESALVMTSFLLLLALSPYILQDVIWGFLGGAFYVAAGAFIGLFIFIIPGLLIGLVGFAVLLTLLILFMRGCLHVTIRYLNWGRQKYYLAQEDVYLNDLFASSDA